MFRGFRNFLRSRLALRNAHDAGDRGRECGGDDREVLGAFDLAKHENAPRGADEARPGRADREGDHL